MPKVEIPTKKELNSVLAYLINHADSGNGNFVSLPVIRDYVLKCSNSKVLQCVSYLSELDCIHYSKTFGGFDEYAVYIKDPGRAYFIEENLENSEKSKQLLWQILNSIISGSIGVALGYIIANVHI